MSAPKNHPQRVGRGICGGMGFAHTPTYNVPPLEVGRFSVRYIFFPTDRNPFTNTPSRSDMMPLLSGDNKR
jgi:hypothetical protein